MRHLLGLAMLPLLATCAVVPRPAVAPPPSAPIRPQVQPVPATPTPVAPLRTDFLLDRPAVQGGIVLGQAPGGTATLSFQGEPVPLAPDGRFLVAFDRDAPASTQLIARLGDGRLVQRILSVAPGDWAIERVNADPLAGHTSAEFARRRPAELARIREAKGAEVASDGWRQSFLWPVHARLSGHFGSQRIYRGTPGSYHSGSDLAAPAGTIYRAPADGVVTLAADSPFTLEGRLLIVSHGMGLSSAFLHSSELLVREGERVKQGQPLGRVGATGRATGPHLHWGLSWKAARLDPEKVVGTAP